MHDQRLARTDNSNVVLEGVILEARIDVVGASPDPFGQKSVDKCSGKTANGNFDGSCSASRDAGSRGVGPRERDLGVGSEKSCIRLKTIPVSKRTMSVLLSIDD